MRQSAITPTLPASIAPCLHVYYRVTFQVDNWVWADCDFGYSTFCQILILLMGDRHKELSGRVDGTSNSADSTQLQGDTSRWPKPPVDIDVKVAF